MSGFSSEMRDEIKNETFQASLTSKCDCDIPETYLKTVSRFGPQDRESRTSFQVGRLSEAMATTMEETEFLRTVNTVSRITGIGG